MADTIGSQNFIALYGALNGAGYEVENITNPNINGNAFRYLGARALPAELAGVVDATDSSTAHGLVTTYAAMRGTLVTITKDSVSYATHLILDVKVTEIKAGVTAAGGISGGSWLVRSQWTVQYAGT